MSKGMHVSIRGVSKTFGTTKALVDVDYDAHPGKVNVIIGENGAGKTTLMRVLFGLVAPDTGTVNLNDESLGAGYSPRFAIEKGIGLLQQHFSLIPVFTVLENIVLGQEPGNGAAIDRQYAKKRLKEIFQQLDVSINPDSRIDELSVAECQLVEIARMLYAGSQVLIFDEPTASLAPQEIERFYALVGTLAGQGATVILITHRLSEVMDHGDLITVMRRGQITGSFEKKDVDEGKLIKAIVPEARMGSLEPLAGIDDQAKPLLHVENLSCLTDEGRSHLSDVNLTVRPGEILGVAGVSGSGQKELVETLVGIRKSGSGRIVLNEADVTDLRTAGRRTSGLVYIPEDRFADGIISTFPLTLNRLLGDHKAGKFRKFGGYDTAGLTEDVSSKIKNYNIAADDPLATITTLSGGNQQKLMLARELDRNPLVIIAHAPTRGLDVAASRECYQRLTRLSAAGAAIVLCSSELDDLLRYTHRIAVLFSRKLLHVGETPTLDASRVGLVMTRGLKARAGVAE